MHITADTYVCQTDYVFVSVCLLVGLSVGRINKNIIDEFLWTFWNMYALGQETDRFGGI